MIFKQKILWKRLLISGIAFVALLVFPIVLFIHSLIKNEWREYLIISSILFLPIILLSLLWDFWYLEWYYVYADHIEVRTIYGIKNIVYYSDVLFVEEKVINLTIHGDLQETFYIFNDGRKKDRKTFGIGRYYNRKKYNLRIYKTKELENYNVNTLKIKIVSNISDL